MVLIDAAFREMNVNSCLSGFQHDIRRREHTWALYSRKSTDVLAKDVGMVVKEAGPDLPAGWFMNAIQHRS
jgi:hypothetical protein